jgi:hypothetical protein
MTPVPANRTEQGRFPAGVSGNPSGRPKVIAALEAKIRETHGPGVVDVLAKVREMALAGDVNAARVFLDRVMGPAKAPSEPQALPSPAKPPEPSDPLATPAEALLARLLELVSRQVAALEAKADTEGLTAEESAMLDVHLRTVAAAARGEDGIQEAADRWVKSPARATFEAEACRLLGFTAAQLHALRSGTP